MFFFPKSTNILWAFLSKFEDPFRLHLMSCPGRHDRRKEAGHGHARRNGPGRAIRGLDTKNHCWVMLKYYYYVVYWGTWLYYNHGNTSNYLEHYWWQSHDFHGTLWLAKGVSSHSFAVSTFPFTIISIYCHNVLRHVPMNIHKYYLFWNRRPGSPHATNTLISAEFVGLPFSPLN